jgi:predicted lipoprotein with Yx(FWY)xxD motif/plastocyanin
LAGLLGAAVAVLPTLASGQPTGSFTAVDLSLFSHAFQVSGATGNQLTISQGGTVSFGYPSGSSAHNVDFNQSQQQPSSCNLPSNPTAAPWSGSCTFNAPGTYVFHCDLHPTMTGTIVVEASGTTTGTTPGPTGTTTITTPPPKPPKPGPTIKLRQTKLGKILTNGRGFTLYLFAPDSRNRDTCIKKKGCLSVWPVVATAGNPIAASGVKKSRLGAIRLKNGVLQVTYAGRPLYGYAGDRHPGQTSYVGIRQFGGKWFAVDGRGRAVK